MKENSSLKSKAAKGMAWSAIGTFSTQGISFVIGIILARILMPSDYGLIGMLAIFFAVSQLLVESGFSNALIQKIDRTETDYSTIFYFNLLVSFVIYLILFFIAPLISQFYDSPELTLLTRVLSLNIPIGSLAIVQQARMKIMLDFKTPALITILSVAISGTLGVILAYSGYGVWALVVQSLSSTIVKTLLLFVFNKWLPQFYFSISTLKHLFGFSSKLLVAGLVANIVQNLYSILIGKLFSPKDVGFYTRARQFPELLSGTITSILQGVTFPILTSLQNDRERMLLVYGRLMRITVFFVMPLLTLFALIAEPFIRLLLTEKWIAVVPLIQWLCFARMITPISALNMNILNAIGRSDLYLKVDLSKLPLVLGTMAITVPLGINVVVIGNFFTSVVSFFINAYYPGKMFGYGPFRQIKEMKYVILSTLIMAICVLSVTYWLRGDLLRILVGSSFGIISFLLSAYLFKIEELNEVKKMASQLISKIKSRN
jgi:O-antigen/teichoic acid export membrane protein